MENTHQNSSIIGEDRKGKSNITRFFDTIDQIDRKLYGKKLKLLIRGAVLVLIASPLVDLLFEEINRKYPNDALTFLSTLVFFLFVILLTLAFVGSWRDDDGNWTWKRAQSRLMTYYDSFKDSANRTRTNSNDELLFQIGQAMFWVSIVWKSFQNLSVFVRKPIEQVFNSRLTTLRSFEKSTNQYYWVVLMIGLGILIYLYRKNPQILERIKSNFGQLLGLGNSQNSKYAKEVVAIVTKTETELVINAKREDHITKILSTSNSNLFSDFIRALQNWQPRRAYYEYEFQDSLFRHLRKY
jgi:hypothetical protein